jgi:segregation and condensation protein A
MLSTPEPAEAGQGVTPRLSLGAFDGPLALLLDLARAEKIDLSSLSLPDLLDQLGQALRQAAASTSLGEKATWLVMAAWLVLLRSRLLLPLETAAQQAAEDDARQLRARLLALQAAQALAAWLTRRPQLGQDVFPRGQPECLGQAPETQYTVDVVEFLWASLALFDGDRTAVDTTAVYTPPWFDLHSVAAARTRILQHLAGTPDGVPLARLLPPALPREESPARTTLHRRSAWSSTLLASLELTRLGSVVLHQPDPFTEIHVCPAADAGPLRRFEQTAGKPKHGAPGRLGEAAVPPPG